MYDVFVVYMNRIKQFPLADLQTKQ